MYSMVIVDDNPRDREGVRTALDWSLLEIDIVGSFEDAAEALDRMDELQPHILLTDVDMPIINGIEMTKRLKVSHPEIKVIFMSCHDEFDFVKSAIDLHSYGYILKPIDEEELRSAVEKALEVYQTKRKLEDEKRRLQVERQDMREHFLRTLPQLQEQYIRELLFGAAYEETSIRENLDYLQLQLPESCMTQVILIELPEVSSQHIHVPDTIYFAAYVIKKYLSQSKSDQLTLIPLSTSGTEVAAVVLYKSCGASNLQTAIMDLLVELKEELNKDYQWSVSIGISSASDQIADWAELYRQASEALHAKFYTDDDHIVTYEEIKSSQVIIFDRNFDFAELYKQLRELLAQGDSEQVERFVQELLRSHKLREHEVKHVVFSVIHLLQSILLELQLPLTPVFTGELSLWEELSAHKNLREVHSWLAAKLTAVLEYVNRLRSGSSGPIVERIKQIIGEQYHEHLTIGDIAKHVNYSAIHANNLFKKETGKTIFDYLTEHRMERAKELLRDPQSKVYVVAEQVGYTSKSHFMMSFKKYAGCSPTTYKHQSVLS
ncbi:response regulator [Paenibacillus sp. GCM10023252]|uniref:response regulator n=1 Tax=Paenibacillus sp. GCM10023252 TaxID=3252649 RepID=UPI0036075887